MPSEIVARVMSGLSETIGVRFSASEGEHRAAEFLSECFREQGLPTTLQRLGFVGWSVTRAPTLTVTIGGLEEPLEVAPVVYSAPADDLTGTLRRYGVKVLIAGLYEMPTLELVDDDGIAVAQVVVNAGGDAIPLINPNALYRVPMVVVSARDGERLLAAVDAGTPVTAKVSIGTRLDPDAYSYNVIATYEGDPSSSDYVVVCAHYDTQLDTPGAYDNASGTAGMFGVLEHLRANDIAMNVKFVGIAGEEVGMFGSHFFVNDLTERGLLGQVRYCVCLDQISGGDFFWLWCTDPDLRATALDAIEAANVAEIGEVRVDDNKPGADHWAFHERGIPALLLMWWRQADYHKPGDTYDKVDFTRVDVAVDAAGRLLASLAKQM
ncbi:M28 family metallopeptidase [Nonomuraea sp. NPDC050790]|uniref:M28 family metallopeptidase n=1 Tax=Nonomuraea sp. NPDC050790 TaxID=3364371 RepID=UPI00379B7007